MKEFEKTLSYQAFCKSPEPSLKVTTYFQAYDTLLAKYRGREITFVEIGVLNGGSLFMWREFFGPEARIIGVDLNPGAKKWEQHGFEILIGSQQDPEFLQSLCEQIGPIDVLLDDGGHMYLQQVITAECLLDQITDGGVLIVEDTHTSYMEGFGDPQTNFMRYVFQTAHRINSRFGQFSPPQEDKRVLSVQIFESIVAFFVDRQKSEEESRVIWNHEVSPEDIADDFRHQDQSSFEKSASKIKQLMRRAFSTHMEDPD